VALLVGGGVGANVIGGGVKPKGAPAPEEAALPATLVLALVVAVKNLSNICGETTASGEVAAVGAVTGSLASNSSAGPLVTATDAGGALVVLDMSGGVGGMGGVGREMGTGGK
jgi:hypothetical protein